MVRLRGRRLTFALSEAARLRLTVKRGGWTRARSFGAAAGRSTVLLPVRARGRYRVGLVARDAAGNGSTAVSGRVRLR